MHGAEYVKLILCMASIRAARRPLRASAHSESLGDSQISAGAIHPACRSRRPAGKSKALSLDLRERVLAATAGWLSGRQADDAHRDLQIFLHGAPRTGTAKWDSSGRNES